MSKIKNYSRHLVILFVALATVFTCIFAFTPEADAGATAYKWRVSYQLDQGNNNTESCYVKLYYKTNNGTGTEGSIEIEGDDITFDKDKNGWYYWTSDASVGAPSSGGSHRGNFTIPANAFPTKVDVFVKCVSGSPAYQEFRIYSIKLEVMNQSGSVLATSNTTNLTISSSKDEQSATATVSIGTGSYPYVANWSVSGVPTSVNINRDGSNVSYNASISAEDNYGVNWVNAPTTTGSNCTVNNGSTASPTIVFGNKTTDYSASFTSKWTTANSSNSTVSKTFTISSVKVPHKLTIDANGGTYNSTNPVTGNYTSEYIILATPVRTGYTFASWTKTAGNGVVNGNNFTFGNDDGAVSANWTPVQYTISPVYGGNAYSDVSYNIETTSISLPTPTRTGYTFAGWVVSVADGNWTVGESVSGNPVGKYGNITVEPSWTANSYTLNFNANKTGAQVSPASKAVKFDNAVGDLPVPTVTAYDFTGWFTAAADGTQVTASTVYTTADNSTVYAHWTPVTYNIAFNTDGGNSISAITYDIEDASVELPVPTKTGYTFSHWIVEKQDGNWTEGETANGTLSANYGNVTLKAVYTANKYTLNFNLNTPAGAVTEPECEKDSITVTFNAAAGNLPVPTLDGYTFAGWFTEATGGSQVTASTVYTTADDSTVYAKWTPATYNIIYNENGGSTVADGTYTIEGGTLAAGNSLTGYTFSHWEVVADSGNWVAGDAFDASADITGKYGNVELKAVWASNDYTVSFDLNDTTGVGSATADKTTVVATFNKPLGVNENLPVASRNGYTFIGWFTAADGGEQVTADTVYTTAGETTYYAHWELVTYTVTFDTDNGDAIEPLEYTIEDSLVLPAANKYGFNFSFWLYNQTTNGLWVKNAKYDTESLTLGTGFWGNVTIKAYYSVKSFTITWIVNGVEEQTTHPFNTVPSHPDPAVTDDPCYNYEFTGWSPTIGIVTGDASYTATFNKTPKSYTVTWVDKDGNTVHTESVKYGDAVPTDVDAPARTGYTVEWNYDGITTMPAENITIEAVYTPIKYAIHWEVEGVVVGTDMVDYDSLPSYTGATPVKAEDAEYSYVFKGWTPKIVPVTGETTYVAEFTAVPQEYTITFVADGTTVSSYPITFGSAITVIPAVPEKIGYVGSWQSIPATMPANNVTINAKYVKGALVTWYLDGTSTGASYQLGFENGEQIDFDRENPTKPADAEYTYTFEGWSTTPGGELITGYPVAGETDLAYYAVYSKTANEYTITWIADGDVVLEETIAFGSDVSNVPDVPDKKGHTGVWGAVPSTMPAKDVTVTAEYTPIDYTITWVVDGNATETTFAYGTMPEFTGVTSKPSNATTDFTFDGWDKDVTVVEGDATYTAQYIETARKYVVTWELEDGTLIDTDSVANGSEITYIPVIPEKEGHDAKYTKPDVMPTENITIVVTYEARSYTITWSTPAGDYEETWKYGETPVFDTDKYGTPAKDATAEKQYTFSGWNPVVGKVTGDATYNAVFAETARKYSVVWYVDGEFYDSRDIAFGSVIPTLTVPEKTGYIGVWDNPFRTMPAKDLTINATYTARKYTVYWKVDGLTVYSASVSFGSAIPTQKVPEKAGCTGEWVNVPDTMPAENITITAEYTAKQFTVTWRIDGVTNTATATYGIDYTLTFEEGKAPEELRITIGGVAVSAEAYVYDATTGKLVIPGTSVTGDIVIVARAAGGNCNVLLNLFGGTSSNDSDVVPERNAYFTQLVPDAGYLLPSEVSVYVDGMYMSEGYTYDSKNGKLIINAEIVIGEIEIYAEFPENPNYNPDAEGGENGEEDTDCNCNCHSKNALTKFFFDLVTFLRKLFGMEEYRYCGCGKAHW